MTSSMTAEPLSDRLRSTSWWFRSADGRQTLWQPPNPALSVWLVTVVLEWLNLSAAHASPFRRILGAIVLAVQIAILVHG